MKRILSLLLVAAMLMGMLPVSAMADEFQSAVEKTTQLQSVLEELLCSLEPEISAPIKEEPAVTVTAVATTPFPLASGSFGDHTYYYYGSNSYTWDEAVAICASMGGYPAAISSQEENDFLYQLVRSAGAYNAHFGLTDLEESRVWKWVNGEELVYTNWASGEPNDTGENYGMFYSGYTTGQWNDGVFSGSPFLLEVPSAVESLEGVCGDGVNWSYDDGMLTISGEGTINDSAFQGNPNITAVVIEEGVTGIGASAFQNCTGLVSVTLPDSLTFIGYHAFYNCDGFTEITIPAGITGDSGDYWFEACDNLVKIVIEEGATVIPDGAFRNLYTDFEITIPVTVTAIQENAFRNCTGLTGLTLPDTITTIARDAFVDCVALTDFVIPASVTTIGYHAFYNCDGFTEITIPAGVTGDSGDYWFEACDNLMKIVIADGATVIPDGAFRNLHTDFEITIPETVTVIQENAFRNCTGLTGLTLPDTITTIARDAFVDCVALTDFVIPASVTTIGYHAFYNCDGFTEITIPAGVTGNSGDYWFEACDNLVKIVIADGATVIPDGAFRNLYTDFEITIPETVTAVQEAAFYNCTGLTSIVLPASMTALGRNAFGNCTALTEFVIPDAVTSMSYRVFYNCDGLTEITIPANATGGDYWFEGCDNLTKIVITEGATAVPAYAFRNLYTEFEIIIPDTVTSIGRQAFVNCTGLKSVSIPEGVTSIGYNAFRNCDALTEITIPASVTSGDHWFEDCDNLAQIAIADGATVIPDSAFRNLYTNFAIIIPDTVTTIQNAAFCNCTGLEAITLPDGLLTLGYNAFRNCDSLQEITIPAGVTGGNYWFEDCDNLAEIVLEEGMQKIPNRSFSNLRSEFEITIPDTVTAVGEGAFYGCTGVKQILLPDSLTFIDGSGFRDCTALESITLPVSLTDIYGWAFSNCDSLTEITIPASVTSSGDGHWFIGCDNLTKIELEEGMTRIPNRAFAALETNFEITIPETVTVIGEGAFYGCTGLRQIQLPTRLTTIDGSGFRDCTALETIAIPNSVTYMDGWAFHNCPNVVLSCSMDSYALEYAMQHNLLVDITDWTRPESDILVMENSYYNTNSSDVNASGYIDLVVHYELQEDQIENLSGMKLRVLLQGTLVLLENSVRLDGTAPDSYTYSGNVLTVPVESASGTLRFSVNPESATRLFSRAELVYTLDGTTDSEIIDCINSDMPVLTLVTKATVNSEDIRVSGIAPAESTVTFYIDDVEAGTAAASKAGNYSAELTIPDPAEGKIYIVKASVTVNDTVIEKSMSVTYDLSSPVLEELLLYYSGHEKGYYENYIVDMTDPHAGRTVITFNPSMTYTFRVKMTNPEMISCLYVTSTRNGQTKYIEAVYDEASGYFVTSDKFDKDVWNYVPGEIGIVFDLSYTHIDRDDPVAVAEALIDETAENTDVTDISVEVMTSDEKNLNFQTTMPDGTEIVYQYHEYTNDEMYNFLVFNGIIDSGDTVSVASVVDGEELLKLLGKVLQTYTVDGVKYYFGKTDKGYFLTTSDHLLNEDDGVFKMWFIETTATDLVSYTLDSPDSFLQQGYEVGKDTNVIAGMFVDAGVATYKYFNKTWQLNMQMIGATEAEKAQIRETQEVLTFVLVSRYVLAVAKASLTIYFAANPIALVAVGVGMFLMSDLMDSLEEEGDWVTGFDNSLIGMITCGFDYGIQWLIDALLKWIIDPSGYVYEAVTDNRLSGVTATVYYQDPETGEAILWDAGEYDQVNPIITRGDGVYAWDVPEGLWQVKYELEGYETVYSDWMEVPPPQTDVNVGLVSYAVPEAQWIDVYHDSVEITFSKYMIPETVGDIVLTDEAGNAIAYTLVYDDSQTGADGTVYAKEFSLEFESVILDSGDVCGIAVPETVQSYAGVGAAAATLTAVCTEQIVISAAETVTVPYGGTAVIPVSLSAADLEIEGISLFAELLTVEALEQTGTDTWNITVSGKLPGATAILITVPGTNVSKTVTVEIKRANHVHTAVTDDAVSATCTETGLTEGSHCGECGEVLIPQTEIPALGHSWDDGTVTREPTASVEGEMLYTCTVCGETRKESIPLVEQVNWVSASVSLAGDIGLNYYVELSEDLAANADAYVQFTFAGGTQTVPMGEAIQSNGTYRFSCAVPAKHMADSVTAQMYSGSEPVGPAKTYSVKAYCDAAIPVYGQYAAYADLVTLMKAMLNYGAYSQLSLGYATDNLANAGLATEERLLPETVDASAYAHSVIGSEDGIMVYSASLLLESKTTIRFYFRLTGDKTIDQYEFLVNGIATVPTASGSLYYVDVPNVAAKDLDEMQTVTVGGMQVSYCGLSYVNQMMTWAGITEAGLNVVKALYVYNQVANAYFE